MVETPPLEAWWTKNYGIIETIIQNGNVCLACVFQKRRKKCVVRRFFIVLFVPIFRQFIHLLMTTNETLYQIFLHVFFLSFIRLVSEFTVFFIFLSLLRLFFSLFCCHWNVRAAFFLVLPWWLKLHGINEARKKTAIETLPVNRRMRKTSKRKNERKMT